jgi:integrase
VTKSIDREAVPKQVRGEQHRLTAEQVETLASKIDPRYRVLILFASYTGMRIGEITALQVQDVDFLRRTVRVSRSDTEISGKLSSGTPKSGKARTVPVPAFLIDELASHVAGKDRDAYIFTAPEGGRHRQSRFLEVHFHKALKAAGLDPELDFHDLRHTAASLMVSAGANVKAVQNALGHASAAMTLDVYADLFDTDAQAVADGLDRIRAAACGPTVAPASPAATNSQVRRLPMAKRTG